MTNKDLLQLIENFSNSLDTGVLKMEEMIFNCEPHILSDDVIKITSLLEGIANKNDKIQDILDKGKKLEGSARRIINKDRVERHAIREVMIKLFMDKRGL